MSYKLSKKSGFYGSLSVLLVSSGWMVATSARAQNVIDIFRQVAPANVRPYIPTSTPKSNSTSAPSSNTSSDSRATNEAPDPNLAVVVFKTTLGAVKVNGSTTIGDINSSRAQVRLLVKDKPLSLTVYFKYKETDKQIIPLRSLRLSIRSSEQGSYEMAQFKNVNVSEEK